LELINHRSEFLDSFIGQYVEIMLFDGQMISGSFDFVENYSQKYNYRRPGYYTCGCWSLRKSHIKSIRTKE